MFIDFFYFLRERGLNPSVHEFLTLLEALQKGLAQESLDVFYAVARSILVKKPELYDRWDLAFAEYFQDATIDWSQLDAQLHDDLLTWLEDPKAARPLTDEERAQLEALDLEELRRRFEERLQEQTERHDGGNRWIGTGGTSPFGHSGTHPGGIRVGGQSQGRSAVQVATQRRFQNLRSDITLDVRDFAAALRRLRILARDGQHELDLDATIDRTAQNFGDIELVFERSRKNDVKLLLLMDTGGSMTPWAHLTSRLFSAAHQASHFKQFQSYTFHNCPYETLFLDIYRQQGRPTKDILAQVDPSWRCIIVGDAAMAPYELTDAGGSIDYFHMNEESGLTWLNRIREHIPRTVWLNPDSPKWWSQTWTTRAIASLFPMFPLTLEGLDDAVAQLKR